MFHMRKKILLLTSMLLLASCGGSSSSTKVVCATTYWDGTVGTCLPAGWNALSREEVQARGMPAEVILAFQAEEAVSGQYPTVTVTTEPLTQDLSARTYSQASADRVARRKDYTKIDLTDLTVDGQKVHLHVFSAQPVGEEPRQRFYQVATVAKNKGYVFTGALPLTASEKTVSEVKLVLTNATFSEPKAKE